MHTADEPSELGDALVALRDEGDGSRVRWEQAGIKARLFGGAPPRRAIGRYELVERLGAGGMGEVFAARDPQLDRPVAIKLLHADLRQDTEEHRARMIREAKTLAKLSHPNVVQIYEVGEAEGRVFLAMELVRGVTLRRWQQDERPGWRLVLARYQEAGRGLVAVHRAGLVHRDFKPDNVLLGADGRVCVADFGLARHASGPASSASGSSSALDATVGTRAEPSTGSGSGHASPTRLTHTGRIAGTLAYMAPEQLRAEELDARADQFGFCVALYEALYGRRPFEGRTVAALMSAHEAGPTVPSRRAAVPRRLWRVLARGLAQDCEARFESMEALLRALDPARARRRRIMVAVAGLAVPALYGAIAHEPTVDPCPRPTAEVLGWGDDARAQVRAVIEGSGLAYASATSEAVVVRLDRLADQLAEQRVQACRATHVEHVQSAELLDQRMLCLSRISDRARGLVHALGEAEPDALDRVVEAVEGLPRPDRCGAEQVAWGVRSPHTPAQATAVAHAQEAIAEVRAQHDLGRDRSAKERLDADEPAILALDHPPLTAELRLVQGLVLRGLGDPTRAAALMLEGVELAEGSRHDLAAAELWNELALLGHEELSIKETEAWLPRARGAVQRIGAPPELTTTIAHHEGRLALRRGELDHAAEVLERVLAQRRAQDLPLEVARAAEDLVELWKLRDDPQRALALLAEVGTLYAAQLGDRHPRIAKTEYHVATMLIAQGRWDEARTHLDAALALWTERYGADHLHVALVHTAQHQVELVTGSLDAALHHARQALRIRRALLPAAHPDVAYSQMVLGVSLMVRGEPHAAAEAYTAAWNGLRAASGEDDLMANLARANLSEAELAAGRSESARGHAEAARRVLQAQIPDHPATALPIKVLGKLALATGRPTEALVQLRRAQALLEAASTVDPLEHGDVLLALCDALTAAGEPGQAAALARQAAEGYAAATGEAGQGGLRRALARSRDPAPTSPSPEERSP